MHIPQLPERPTGEQAGVALDLTIRSEMFPLRCEHVPAGYCDACKEAVKRQTRYGDGLSDMARQVTGADNLAHAAKLVWRIVELEEAVRSILGLACWDHLDLDSVIAGARKVLGGGEQQ